LGILLATNLKVFPVENEECSEVDVSDFLISEIDLRTEEIALRRRGRPGDRFGVRATDQRNRRADRSYNRHGDL